MKNLKEIIRKVPAFPALYGVLRNQYTCYKLKLKGREQVFTDIYNKNYWGGKESVSGRGSDTFQTRLIVKEISVVFKDYGISTLLDIPCGDFHWMKDVDLTDIDYIGSDIVNNMIEKNIEKYKRDGLCFQKLDLLKDELPKVDLIFCRDIFVHLSFEDIFHALNNICTSQSEYLLTTIFTERTRNHDIATSGWRVLNLELAPFRLPKPLKVINEGCTESSGAYSDKSLGLWRIDDIREILKKHCT